LEEFLHSAIGSGGKPMNGLKRNLIGAVVVLLVACLAAYAIQAPTAPAAKKTFDGQLLKVDVETKTIEVRGTDNRAMRFLYTDQTEIVGAQNGAQGLSSTLGTRIKVEYTEKSGIATASKIEVLPKEATTQ
jgi:hypothetical protein